MRDNKAEEGSRGSKRAVPRGEKGLSASEAREKAAWIAQRKRQEEEIHRAERRAEAAARRREKEAREAEQHRRAQRRAAKRRRLLRGLKVTLLVVMLATILLGCGWLVISNKLNKGELDLPKVNVDGILDAVGAKDAPAPQETEQVLEQQPVTPEPEPEVQWDEAERQLRVELPMGLSFQLDRQAAGLVKDRIAAEQLDRDYVRGQASAAVEQFRAMTSGEGWFMDHEAQVLHVIKGAGQLDLDLDKLCAAAEEALLGSDAVLTYDQVEGQVTPPNWLQLKQQVSVEPINAHFSDSSYEVLPGTPGLSFDMTKARHRWQKAAFMEEILIPMEPVEPKVTVEELFNNLFKDCLGSQTSSYGGSSRARINNINLAVSMIDGVILMPGDTFSYNETVGQRTLERGFQEAPAYASGEVVSEVGGGICQVSSTLYCASLYSRMTIVDRTYHYFRVNYLPPGQDATVSWESPDFKFRNDRDYPVKIVARCDNDNLQLTIEIWGTDTDGITVSLYCEQYAIHDSEYPEVVIGSNVYLYINYYDADGNLIETRKGSASTYHRHDYEIEWPPEKFQDEEDEGGGTGEGTVIIDDPGGGESGGGETGGDTGGGDTGGGETGGGETGGDTGGGDTGGGDEGGSGGDEGGSGGEVIIEEP